ncbi:hypothetical protein AAH991_36430 [Microbispora sp. ZYX-F-249]|uniref:Uncharacterized protein n=1 Tax=Microbispora maris TaxID=3144104 RepID=A0ABV0AZF2_9ACTN
MLFAARPNVDKKIIIDLASAIGELRFTFKERVNEPELRARLAEIANLAQNATAEASRPAIRAWEARIAALARGLAVEREAYLDPMPDLYGLPRRAPAPDHYFQQAQEQTREALSELESPLTMDVGHPDGMYQKQSLPVLLYLENTEDYPEVVAALKGMVEAYDGSDIEASPGIWGSVFQRLRMWLRGEDGKLLQAQIQRAAELRLVDESQATVDDQEAAAAAKLIAAFEKIESGTAIVGSLLLVKANGRVDIRNLTPQEITYLKRHPGLIRNPEGVMQALQEAPGGEPPAVRPPNRPDELNEAGGPFAIG